MNINGRTDTNKNCCASQLIWSGLVCRTGYRFCRETDSKRQGPHKYFQYQIYNIVFAYNLPGTEQKHIFLVLRPISKKPFKLN